MANVRGKCTWKSRTFRPRERFLAPSVKERGMTRVKSGSFCSFVLWILCQFAQCRGQWLHAEDSQQTRISMAEATATASDAVFPERPEPAVSVMDSPTFPEADRVDRTDLHEVPCGDSEGCASTASSEPRGELYCSFFSVTSVQGRLGR